MTRIPAIRLRTATDRDMDFLLALREQTMVAHMRNSGLEVDAAGQRERVRHAFEYARIVLLQDAPVGLLKLKNDANPWELVQIQLSKSVQGQGLGAALVSQVLADARAAGCDVVLSVLKANPARRLYERLGFRVQGETEFEFLMRFGTDA